MRHAWNMSQPHTITNRHMYVCVLYVRMYNNMDLFDSDVRSRVEGYIQPIHIACYITIGISKRPTHQRRKARAQPRERASQLNSANVPQRDL